MQAHWFNLGQLTVLAKSLIRQVEHCKCDLPGDRQLDHQLRVERQVRIIAGEAGDRRLELAEHQVDDDGLIARQIVIPELFGDLLIWSARLVLHLDVGLLGDLV